MIQMRSILDVADNSGAPVAGPEREHALAFAYVDPWLGAHAGDERLCDPLAGLGAAGMDDPPS